MREWLSCSFCGASEQEAGAHVTCRFGAESSIILKFIALRVKARGKGPRSPYYSSLSIRPSYGARGEEILDGGGGEGEKRKEGLTQNHSANSVTHPKSGCGSDWITHNTPWRHRPQERSTKRSQWNFNHRCFDFMLPVCDTFMDRDAERNSKRL